MACFYIRFQGGETQNGSRSTASSSPRSLEDAKRSRPFRHWPKKALTRAAGLLGLASRVAPHDF